MNRFNRLSLSAFMHLVLFLGTTGQVGMAQTTQVGNSSGTAMETNITDFDPNTFARTFTHHTAYVNGGIRLHYVRGGQGEPVVLLHGWPTSWYEWRRVMPILAKHYTVIAVDMRGLGDSDKPLASYDKRTMALDIYQLCQQLGFQRISLVGHDWGTSVAFALAHEHPELIRRLVLTDNVIPGLSALSRSWNVLNDHFWHHHFNAEPDLPEELVAGRERIYLTWFYRKLTYNLAAFTNDYVDEFVRVYTLPGSLRAGFNYYQALDEDARQNQEYAKQKLKMPVLVVTADRTVGDMLHQQVQPLAEDYRGTVLKNCGHFIPIERPNELAELVLNFLGDEKLDRKTEGSHAAVTH